MFGDADFDMLSHLATIQRNGLGVGGDVARATQPVRSTALGGLTPLGGLPPPFCIASDATSALQSNARRGWLATLAAQGNIPQQGLRGELPLSPLSGLTQI
jgi:hypothetical protein